MKIGKLPETMLKRSVLKQIGHRRNDIIMGPSIGLDCAAVAAGEEAFVLSGDPITGTTKGLGRQGVLITANDIAASGAEPVGVMLTLLLPPEITEAEIKMIMQDAEKACAELNMEILGGHTEITEAVVRPLITVTGIGRASSDRLVDPSRCKPGDCLIATKWIGIEATAILAKERKELLQERFSESFLQQAMDMEQYLSIVPEAGIAAEFGAKLMHDITEGGIFGALWEIGEAASCGLEADLKKIPIRQETVEICEFFDVNPYQIMSSGSLLIVAEHGEALVVELAKNGIPASLIGRLTEGKAKTLHGLEEVRYLDRPRTDMLYDALARTRSDVQAEAQKEAGAEIKADARGGES